jgi:predicted dehydrogenase
MTKKQSQRKNKEATYTAAIIGCGNIGCGLDRFKPGFNSTHLSAYLANRRTKLVALCDSDRIKAKEYADKHSIPGVYSDITTMLFSERPQIVSICTPDETHYSVLKKVAECGSVKAIWCEKPMAVTMHEAEEMVKLCQKKNIKLLVNHIRRYDPFYGRIKQDMDKIVGKVQGVNCFYSGGIVTTGSHLLDLLDFYFGRCISVSAEKKGSIGKETGKTNNSDSFLFAQLVYDNNIHVNIIPCDNKYFSVMEISITGTKARLETINKPFGRYDYRYFLPEKDRRLRVSFIAGKTKPILPKNIQRDFFDSALSDLIFCIEKNTEPKSSGAVALRSLEVLSAVSYSSKNGGEKIRLPFGNKNLVIPKAYGDVRKWKK